MLSEMRGRLWYVIKSVAPLIGVICLLQVTVVQAPAALFMQFLFGSALMILGLVLLFFGVDMGILPMGRFIGAAIPRKGSLTLIIAVGFAMGFATTIAEPDVMVLAAQVDEVTHGSISRMTVLYVVAIGVAVFVALGMARIVFGVSFRLLLTVSFLSILLVSAIAPAQFVPLAYDAGSVTTGVLTAPVVIALAVGLSSVLAGRSAAEDGFGLLGLASLGPIISIILLGLLLR